MQKIICDSCGEDIIRLFLTINYQGIESHFCCLKCVEIFIENERQKLYPRIDLEFGKEN